MKPVKVTAGMIADEMMFNGVNVHVSQSKPGEDVQIEFHVPSSVTAVVLSAKDAKALGESIVGAARAA